MTPLLEVSELHAQYGEIPVLHGLDFSVDAGSIAVILGANGAGKTTTLRALTGMVTSKGSVLLGGKEICGQNPADIVRAGVAHVPQGRGTFPELTVEDNLAAGAYIRRDRDVATDAAYWYETFPVLGERRAQTAGSLSGGEQQMLAIARALMSRPTLLLLDEPSLGLAPIITQGLFEQLERLNQESSTTMLVVEQNADLALGVADDAYVLEAGQIVLRGPADELRHDEGVRRAYLGY